MGRPAKSVTVSSGKIGEGEKVARQWVEDQLKGAGKPEAPSGLTEQQREIFGFIVDGLVESEILGKMDVFVLESTAIAVDRLRAINNMIDTNPQLIINTALQNSRAKYQSDLWRGCNELCLSPQARAKIGGLAAQKQKESKDPLLEVLRDDDYRKPRLSDCPGVCVAGQPEGRQICQTPGQEVAENRRRPPQEGLYQ